MPTEPHHAAAARWPISALTFIALAGALLGAACTPSEGTAGDRTLLDIDGIAHETLTQPAHGHWSLLLFVGTDCPVSNQYAPEIRRICNEYGPPGLQCSLVYSDRHVTAGQVRAHLDAFGLGHIPAFVDGDQSLAQRAGASVTPQAVVYAADGAPAYSGRIDNLYAELGRPRQAATEHDLRNALDDLVAGRSVRTPRTQAIGCYIE